MTMQRRSFLRGLLGLGAAAATGIALVEPEPVRRFWQVGRGAPFTEGAFARHLASVYGEAITVLDLETGKMYVPTPGAFSLNAEIVAESRLMPDGTIETVRDDRGVMPFGAEPYDYDAAFNRLLESGDRYREELIYGVRVVADERVRPGEVVAYSYAVLDMPIPVRTALITNIRGGHI